MRELRVGLVLYGGVSLAVYMNGIVSELWHGLRASQSRCGDTKVAISGSALVYRELLETLASTAGADELRIVVDTVAGTSAGGVNGAVLAKAVVDGGDAAVLNTVWIEKADIGALKSEPEKIPFWTRQGISLLSLLPMVADAKRKVEKLPGLTWEWVRDSVYTLLTTKDGRVTPLDGRYFACMIAATFKDMGAKGDGIALLPKRGSFDLFMTGTDLSGWPRHLPVSPIFQPTALFERTHAYVMAFRRPPTGGRLDDDFGLTFAARATASFPGAFAPVDYKDMADCYCEVRPDDPKPVPDDFSRRHMREHVLAAFKPDHARMIDGGVLDNKPFTHVARAIEDKPADHQVFRIVAYVEPDPETRIAPAPAEMPRPLAVLQRLYALFRHEPIFGDLRDLQRRNAKVDRIRVLHDANRPDALAAAREAGAAAGLPWPPRVADLDRWRSITNAAAAGNRLSGYAGYVVLKARHAADLVASVICDALDYPYDSRHAFFVRHLVRGWLWRRHALDAPAYVDGEGHRLGDAQHELLSAFDVPFRVRRIRYLVQAVNGCYAGLPDDPVERRKARAPLDACKAALADIAFAYEAALRDPGEVRTRIETALGGIGCEKIDGIITKLAFDPDGTIERFDGVLADIYAALRDRFAEAGDEQNQRMGEAISGLPGEACDAAATALAIFAFVDPAVFPLMDAAEVTDLITVETMRISPQDCVFLSQDAGRLKSRELGAFAGFLERSAREHDLMWGRLDGAERLTTLIFAAAVPDPDRRAELASVQREFTRRAMLAILEEEAARPGTSAGALANNLRTQLDAMA